MEIRLLFKDEVNNVSELEDKLNEIGFNLEYKMGVIGMVIDQDNKVIYQRRGPKANGDCNMLSDVGGAVEDYDVTFRDALYRELKEEVGNDVNVEIEHFMCAFLKVYFDHKLNREVNRIFLVYKMNLIDGEFKINEPGKAIGYEKYDINNIPNSEVMETSLFINDFYIRNYL